MMYDPALPPALLNASGPRTKDFTLANTLGHFELVNYQLLQVKGRGLGGWVGRASKRGMGAGLVLDGAVVALERAVCVPDPWAAAAAVGGGGGHQGEREEGGSGASGWGGWQTRGWPPCAQLPACVDQGPVVRQGTMGCGAHQQGGHMIVWRFGAVVPEKPVGMPCT